MSRKEIITTIVGRAKLPIDDYEYPSRDGEFTGALVFRAWHPKSPCLLCFFDADDGSKYKLAAWWDKDYRPKKSLISFADDVKNGSR